MKRYYYELKNKENMVEAKKVIIAPGRTGAKWVQELADKYNIDYSHFSQFIGIKKHTDNSKVDIESYFSNNTNRGTTAMKRIILRENLIEYKCSCCGN